MCVSRQSCSRRRKAPPAPPAPPGPPALLVVAAAAAAAAAAAIAAAYAPMLFPPTPPAPPATASAVRDGTDADVVSPDENPPPPGQRPPRPFGERRLCELLLEVIPAEEGMAKEATAAGEAGVSRGLKQGSFGKPLMDCC